MKGFVITTENKAFVRDFAEPVLDGIKDTIHGWPEQIYPVTFKNMDLSMFVDDEGVLKHQPLNAVASVLYGFPQRTPIVGDVVIIGQVYSRAQGTYILKGLTEQEIDMLKALCVQAMPEIELACDSAEG